MSKYLGLRIPCMKKLDKFNRYKNICKRLISPTVHMVFRLYMCLWILFLCLFTGGGGVNQKVLPVLSTETLLHIWLSTEYYDCRPSSTAIDTVSLHALDPTVPRKRMQIGFLLAPIVKEASNIVSSLLMSFLLQRLT